MNKTPNPKYRPAPEDRWIDGMRTEPVRLAVRTEWLYSEYNPKVVVPEGRTRHPFATGGDVVASDVPSPYESQQDFNSHMHRAVSEFGDDKDLIVEVRLAHADPSDAEVEALAVEMWKHSDDERRWDEVAETWLHLARMGLRAMRAQCTPNTPNATDTPDA